MNYADQNSGSVSNPNFRFVVEPGSFLEDFLLNSRIGRRGVETDKEQELFELMLQKEHPFPGFRVDPNQLDLREFRRPGPSSPSEFLERDYFLLTSPRSPLT